MCDSKLSSDEVPRKFSEWLLSMGCPPEKVPSEEKVVEMCRGQYYMVWRSLMEHVEPKETIRQKRLQVFCDDVQKWKGKNVFNKHETNALIPEQIKLWHQHKDIQEKVENAETRIAQAQHDLKQLMDKISSKMSHRNLSKRRVADAQRRVWLLQQVAEELKTRKQNLQETSSIANSLCLVDEDVDVQSKLDRYLLGRRPTSAPAPASSSLLASNPVASSSVVSNGDVSDSVIAEEQLSWLMKCRGSALWTQLYERRARLVAALATHSPHTKPTTKGVTPQSVLSHTAALHCSLALEAMKNRMLIKQTRKRLAAAVSELNNYLSGEACELLVVRCERARSSARGDELRSLLDDLNNRTGVFSASDGGHVDDRRATTRLIAARDRAIESKKDELKKLVSCLTTTEKKIQNVRECLVAIFNGFQKDLPLHDNDRFRGQLEFPQESIVTLRQFYEERRERRRNKVQLSMDLDATDDCSFTQTYDNNCPKFVDELKIYMKKFNLEKNRKLILESGEKIWVFETLQSAAERLYSRWRDEELTTSLLCPSLRLSRHLNILNNDVQYRALLEVMLQELESGSEKQNIDIDISLKTKQEDEAVDKIKKRLNENLLALQKTSKTLDKGQENLNFWSENRMKKHVSLNRTVDGKTLKDFEDIYIESLSLNI